MNSDEYILTINPDPTKHGERIPKADYEIIREAILDNLYDYGPMTFSQLGVLVEEQLQHEFDGSVTKCYAAVKTDMEARGEIRRVPKTKPELLGMVENSRNYGTSILWNGGRL